MVCRKDYFHNQFSIIIESSTQKHVIFIERAWSVVRRYLIYWRWETRERARLGRRRKKTLRVVHKTLPKVFACPRCGLISIRITSEQDEPSQDFVFHITCGNPNCPLHAGRELRYTTKRADIDVYNTFVDDYAKAGV